MHIYLIAGPLLGLATGLPVAWKWQLGMARAAVCLLAGSMLVAMVLAAADPWLRLTAAAGTVALWGGTMLAALAALLALFFRDPDRPVPGRQDVIVSPADGRVVYVRPFAPARLPVAEKHGRPHELRELAGTDLGRGGAVAVGISMNLADVHVNRAPIAGRVRWVMRAPGTFGSLRDPANLLSNERVTTLIEKGDLQVALVQIASRLVRRIVTFAVPGHELPLGGRVGAIRLGSQVDLILPARADIRLAIQVGDRVIAGQTIVALVISEPGGPRVPAVPGAISGAAVRGAR